MGSPTFRPAFLEPSRAVDISVFDSDDNGQGTLVESNFEDNEKFTQHIQTSPCPKLRIVSLYCQTSIRPLKISKCAFEALTIKYNIGPEIWDLACKFGGKPLSASIGEGGIMVQTGDNGIKDINYNITFPVETSTDSWTMRQTGVFHRHNPKEQQNLWVFFHVGKETPAENHIRNYVFLTSQPTVQSTWAAMHSAALFSYLPSWRSYIHYLGSKVEKLVDHSLTMNMSQTEDSSWTSDRDGKLRELHQYSDIICPIQFRLKVAISTLQRLPSLSKTLGSTSDKTDLNLSQFVREVQYHKTRAEGLIAGTEVISYKVQEVLRRFQVSLNLRLNSKMVDVNNRLLTVNNKLLQLGNENFDDNATVKVVTLVTLVYLPASLVSTILGMNLFKFDDGTTDEFIVSKYFWVFIVATVLLTVLTLGLWYAWSNKERLRRKTSNILDSSTKA
ncbi:hypothetical protein N7457_001477 [Penicillium paradoxum]|uniref:uncharacterized protein n=1 Tax=Penicillium paradoxum TaxID=176176 RepID=UPI002546E913|nr:uncharacterized protein N7457_001477 [Penicillium paradoxum]KAJ5794878.1 hypothetical protein N7457_001477 [Penicillium paradoxum]